MRRSILVLLSCKKLKLRQLDTGKGIAVNRSGVDTDFIGLHQRFFQRRVAENYRFTEIVFTVDKLIPDPQQVFGFLGRQRHLGPQAGVDKNIGRSTQPQSNGL